jgi:hypothetical protein
VSDGRRLDAAIEQVAFPDRQRKFDDERGPRSVLARLVSHELMDADRDLDRAQGLDDDRRGDATLGGLAARAVLLVDENVDLRGVGTYRRACP